MLLVDEAGFVGAVGLDMVFDGLSSMGVLTCVYGARGV
jgi:hypothetical protein